MIKWHFTPNLYSSKEINEINDLVNKYIDPNYTDQPGQDKKATTQIARFNNTELEDVLSKMQRTVNQLNEEYFGFNLFNRTPYSLNVNTYRENDYYGFHIDSSSPESANDIKLTAILNISGEPFHGGEFEFFLNGELARIKELEEPGTLIVFPSPLFHRVKPVKMGVRKTISVWYDGPKWK